MINIKNNTAIDCICEYQYFTAPKKIPISVAITIISEIRHFVNKKCDGLRADFWVCEYTYIPLLNYGLKK